jgi:hypothetical protein
VAELIIRTVALATDAPVLSVTVPETEPVGVCAHRTHAVKQSAKLAILFIFPSNVSFSIGM